MNVIFHTTTAIGITALLTDTQRLEKANSSKPILWTAIFAFLVGLISHGALDYIPHCYPINSKFDVFSGLLMIVFFTWITDKKYRIITLLSFIGSIFPDIIDLSILIINKQLGLNLPILQKIFPWHWHNYSGSIYNTNCNISTLNHFLLILTIGIICWCRQTDLKKIIKIKNSR